MRQFVCEVEGEEETVAGVSTAGAAASRAAADLSHRAFQFMGPGKTDFTYRKRCLVKTLVLAPPSQRPYSALRRHVVTSIIE